MKFARAGVIYAAANVASAAVPFALLPLLTRVVSPAEYGHVVGFALLVTLCTTLAGLNAHAALGVLWFKKPHEEIPAYTATALALALGSALVVALLAAGVAWRWPFVASGLGPAWAAAAAITAGANVVLQCRLVLWQSQHKALPNAALQVLASSLNVGLSLAAVLLAGLGGAGRNSGIALASVVMAVLAVALFVRAGELRWAPERQQLRTMLAFGAPLVVHSLAGVLLGTADRWTVAAVLGPHALGVYGAGAQLGMVMAILADAFVKAYGPWLYARLASDNADDKYCAVGAVYIAMPAFFLLAGAVGVGLYWTSALLLGEKYQAASAVLPWFMLGGAFSGVYLCTAVLFFFSGRTGLLAATTMSAGLCGAACTWQLVRLFGVQGAAMGYALTQAILALFVSAVAIKTFDLPWREPLRALSSWSSALGLRRPAAVL